MFTGLVEEIGQIRTVRAAGTSRQFTISAQKITEDIKVDDSICINGVCLTVIRHDADSFEVQAVDETLRKTNLGQLQTGSRVNLERALRPSDRLGGHFVQGHVDGTARITNLEPQAAGKLMTVELPESLCRYVIQHGSIALDGVSLTVARLAGNSITLALIPHTLASTTLGLRRPGDSLNVETDLLGKYIEKLMTHSAHGTEGIIDKLKAGGYITSQ